MSTVDDLVISLTIKPTSDLGRLQKQLDAMVGRRGRGMNVRFMELNRNLIVLKRDIKSVSYGITRLSPTHLAGEGDVWKQREQALAKFAQLKTVGKRFTEPLLRTKLGYKEYYDMFNVESKEEVIEAFMKWRDDALEDLQKIGKGTSGKSPTEIINLLKWVGNVMSDIGGSKLRGKTLATEYMSTLSESEFQGWLNEFFKKFGKTFWEKPLFPVKKEFYGEEKVRKAMEGLGITLGKREQTLITRNQKDILEKQLKLGTSLTNVPKRIDIVLEEFNKMKDKLKNFPAIYNALEAGMKDAEAGTQVFLELKRKITGPAVEENIKRFADFLSAGGRIVMAGLSSTKPGREATTGNVQAFIVQSRRDLIGGEAEISERERVARQTIVKLHDQIQEREDSIRGLRNVPKKEREGAEKYWKEEIKDLKEDLDKHKEMLEEIIRNTDSTFD